jgi:hypothetical protein
MNKSTIIPVIITLIQFLGIMRVFYTHKYKSTQFPAGLIELSIFAIFNFIFLILFYFLFFKIENKLSVWTIPVIIAMATIFFLLAVYIVIFYNKYK